MRCSGFAISLLASVLLLLGPPLAHCKVSPELQKNIDTASEAQGFGEVSKTAAHDVELAPEVKLSAGTGDVDTTGPCQEDIQIFCPSVKPGAMQVAECLSNQIDDETEGRSEFTAQVSDACKKNILGVKMELVTNINFDVKMTAACKEDAAKHCKYTESLEYPAKVIACLREQKPRLSGKCQTQITNAQMAAAQDYRLDAQLFEACEPDAAKVCKDIEPGSAGERAYAPQLTGAPRARHTSLIRRRRLLASELQGPIKLKLIDLANFAATDLPRLEPAQWCVQDCQLYRKVARSV
jgi:hypothetical protein